MFLSPEYEEYSLERMERISLTHISFSFKCFVANQYSAKAIWKLDEDRYKQRLLIRHKMSDDMLRQDRVIRPAHYILLRREVNDTELLGFEWDPEQLEVRIDWKGMYNKFFGEKDAYDRDSSNVVRLTDTYH